MPHDDDVTIALPTADRRTAHDFYRDGLGLEAFGEPASDGLPEPLQFRLRPRTRLMLVPTGGFGWVTGGRPTAEPGTSECLLSLPAASPAAVDELHARAIAAGATEVIAPGRQPWGHAAAFADPDGHVWMTTSSSPSTVTS